MSKQKYPQAASVTADGVKKTGREHYSHAKADARQDKRREEAEERHFKYAGLSISGRIAVARSRPKRGESKREITRLEKLLTAKPAEVVVTVTTPTIPVEDGAVEVKVKHTSKSKVVRAAKSKNPSRS